MIPLYRVESGPTSWRKRANLRSALAPLWPQEQESKRYLPARLKALSSRILSEPEILVRRGETCGACSLEAA